MFGWCSFVGTRLIREHLAEARRAADRASKNNAVSIYPNPASDHIVVIVAGGSANRIDIYDLAGQLMFTKTGIINDQQLEIGHLDSGVYILKLETGTGVSMHKFLKL